LLGESKYYEIKVVRQFEFCNAAAKKLPPEKRVASPFRDLRERAYFFTD
jgi:hypothetical protein